MRPGDADPGPDAFRVTYVGTLRKVNHLELLIRAAALLKEETDIEFLIYGAGEEEEDLKRMVQENGLTRVHMKGYVNGQFVPYILMNYSPIEKYRCGISMGSGSAEELAACIRKIKGMGNEERERMGRNARAGAEDFDAPVLTAKLADVIGYAQREWEKKQS